MAISVIGTIVRNIVVLILVGSFLELLSPRGELAKFIQLAMGLIMVAVILCPLLEAKDDIVWEDILDSMLPETAEVSADYMQQGEQISEYLQGEAYLQYQNELSSQIEAVSKMNPEVKQARAEISINSANGGIESLQLYVVTENSDFATEGIVDTVSGLFGIDAAVIDCMSVEVVEDER